MGLPEPPVAVAVGDLAGTGGPQVYVGANDTVTRLDGVGWRAATEVWRDHFGGGTFPSVADLTGDGVGDLAPAAATPADDCAGLRHGLWIVPGPLVPGSFALDDVDFSLATPPDSVLLLETLGHPVAARAGDADGDGLTDLLAVGLRWASPGAWWPEALVWIGPVERGDLPALRLSLLGQPAGLGDFDGDGESDLLPADLAADLYLGEPAAGMEGAPTLLRGPLAGLPPLHAADYAFQVAETWPTPSPHDPAVAAWVGDLDGDDLADAVVASADAPASGEVQFVIGGSGQ